MKAKLNVISATPSTDGAPGIPSSYEISFGTAGRIGLDGASAYETAVKHGYDGTEEEWAASLVNPADEGAKRAEKAARQAQETADGIKADLTGKASLDNEKKYVVPSQLDPLEGLQSGAICGTGYYITDNELINNVGSKTVELLFTTPSDLEGISFLLNTSHSTRNINVFLEDDTLTVNAVKSYVRSTVLPKTTYHLVMSFQFGGTSYIYLNGAEIGKGTSLSEVSTALAVGSSIQGSGPFKGIIHCLRFFDGALSVPEAEWLWNSGRPGNIRILRQWDTEISRRCVVEYTGRGLLSDMWRDTSGRGIDLSVKGEPKHSYILPQDMNEVVHSTGRITQDIDYLKGNCHVIEIPSGYIPCSMVVTNFNSNNIEDFTVVSSDEENTIVPKSRIREGAWEDRLVWSGSTYLFGTDDDLVVYAKGNKPAQGIEIATTFKWAGHVHFGL